MRVHIKSYRSIPGVIGTLALFLSGTIQRGPGIEMLAAKEHWLLD